MLSRTLLHGLQSSAVSLSNKLSKITSYDDQSQLPPLISSYFSKISRHWNLLSTNALTITIRYLLYCRFFINTFLSTFFHPSFFLCNIFFGLYGLLYIKQYQDLEKQSSFLVQLSLLFVTTLQRSILLTVFFLQSVQRFQIFFAVYLGIRYQCHLGRH